MREGKDGQNEIVGERRGYLQCDATPHPGRPFLKARLKPRKRSSSCAKSRTLSATSAKAVKTQVWTALIAMLVLKYLQLSRSGGGVG